MSTIQLTGASQEHPESVHTTLTNGEWTVHLTEDDVVKLLFEMTLERTKGSFKQQRSELSHSAQPNFQTVREHVIIRENGQWRKLRPGDLPPVEIEWGESITKERWDSNASR